MEMLSTCFLEVHAPQSLSRHAWSMEGLVCFKSNVFPMLDVFDVAEIMHPVGEICPLILLRSP